MHVVQIDDPIRRLFTERVECLLCRVGSATGIRSIFLPCDCRVLQDRSPATLFDALLASEPPRVSQR